MVTMFRRMSILLAVIAGVATSSSPAAAQATCKDIKVSEMSAPVCCSASKGTGCVRNAEDCKLLEGTTKSSDAGCNKGFPGYTGRVARAPEVDCANLKVAAGWTAEWSANKGFSKLSDGKCSKTYSCAMKSPTSVPSPISTSCKAVLTPVSMLITGTCTDAKCSDCKAAAPTGKCTVSLAKK